MDGLGPDEFSDLLFRVERRIMRGVDALKTRRSEDRNFDIKLSYENGLDIILRRHDGFEFPLSELLPYGTRFKKSKIFQYDIDEDVVNLKTSDRFKRHFLPVALHEIGHANEPLPFVICRKYEYGKAKTKNFFRSLVELYETKELNNLGEVFGYDEQAMYELICAKHRYMAKAERNAWQYAFTKMRYLDSSGFNVYNDLNRKKLLRLAKYALRSHELAEFSIRSEFEWPDIDLNPYFVNKPLLMFQ